MALSYLFIWTKSATPQDITSNFSWEVGECVGGPCEEKVRRQKSDATQNRWKKREGTENWAKKRERHKSRKKVENVKVSGTGWGLWWPPSQCGSVGKWETLKKWESGNLSGATAQLTRGLHHQLQFRARLSVSASE